MANKKKGKKLEWDFKMDGTLKALSSRALWVQAPKGGYYDYLDIAGGHWCIQRHESIFAASLNVKYWTACKYHKSDLLQKNLLLPRLTLKDAVQTIDKFVTDANDPDNVSVPPLKVSIYSYGGRSTGKHTFDLEGIYRGRYDSIGEAKEDATTQLEALGVPFEFVK